MPLEGHWQRQHASLGAATRRERRVLAVVSAALVVVSAAVAWVALAGGGAHTPAGCVDVTAASTTGGARLHACGAEAAHWCRTEAGGRDGVAAAVAAACRRAGYR